MSRRLRRHAAAKAGGLWLDYTHGSLHGSRPLGRAGRITLVAAAVALPSAGLWVARSLALALIAVLALATVSTPCSSPTRATC